MNQSASLIGSVADASDAVVGYDGLFDTVNILAILGNGYFAATAFMNEGWMSYNFSKNTTAFATRITMLLDKAAKLKLIDPMYPWYRYN